MKNLSVLLKSSTLLLQGRKENIYEDIVYVDQILNFEDAQKHCSIRPTLTLSVK